MREINFKFLNGGWYALMIDGEEIGCVYKQEHALIIEIATTEVSKLETQVRTLTKENQELTQLNDRLQNELSN